MLYIIQISMKNGIIIISFCSAKKGYVFEIKTWNVYVVNVCVKVSIPDNATVTLVVINGLIWYFVVNILYICMS